LLRKLVHLMALKLRTQGTSEEDIIIIIAPVSLPFVDVLVFLCLALLLCPNNVHNIILTPNSLIKQPHFLLYTYTRTHFLLISFLHLLV